jgi:actin
MTNPTIILDIGQFSSKVGFAGEDSPSLVFLTMVGKPKYQNLDAQYGGQEQELYVGTEIESLGLYKISYPIEKGKITDWDQFEKIIEYIFYNLKVDPTLVNVLFTIHPLFPHQDLERLFQLFLEQYQCMAFYPVLDSMVTLYSGGFQTGLVVEIGDSSTRIVPIYNGYKLDHAVRILDIGGRILTKETERILTSMGFLTESSVTRDLARVLKEKACFVSLDYKEDLNRAEQYSKQFSLPDGATLALTNERFRIPEIIFDPTLVNSEEPPLPVAIMDVIGECDIDIRPLLLKNIFLSGGSSMFPNFKSRIYKELELELARRKKKEQVVKIIAPRERTYSVWVGGSIVAMIPEFSSNWITRAKYYNEGIPPNLL